MFNITNHLGNANQNHRYQLQLLGCLSKSQKVTSVGEDVRKREPLYTVGTSTINKSMMCPQKIKTRTI